jgi:hypothetical protein
MITASLFSVIRNPCPLTWTIGHRPLMPWRFIFTTYLFSDIGEYLPSVGYRSDRRKCGHVNSAFFGINPAGVNRY